MQLRPLLSTGAWDFVPVQTRTEQSVPPNSASEVGGSALSRGGQRHEPGSAPPPSESESVQAHGARSSAAQSFHADLLGEARSDVSNSNSHGKERQSGSRENHGVSDLAASGSVEQLVRFAIAGMMIF